MKSALVFGGTGQLGVAVAEQLLATGWRISVVTRDGRVPPASIAGRARLVDGTGRSRAAILAECPEPVDAVFDPTAYDEPDARDLIQASRWFANLVVVSSASVYASADGRSLVEASQSGAAPVEGPIGEDARLVLSGPETYSTRKVALENALLASGMAVSVLRPCAVYGAPSTHPREWWFIKRALDGRKVIPVAYGAESIFHTSSAAGLAALAALCLETPQQRVLNAADRTALSVGDIAAAIAEATGLELPLAPFEGAPVGGSHVGSTPWSCEHPFVLDTTRAERLGWRPGDYRQEVAAVCRWALDTASRSDWRGQFTRFSQYGYDPFDYAAEDRFLAAS